MAKSSASLTFAAVLVWTITVALLVNLLSGNSTLDQLWWLLAILLLLGIMLTGSSVATGRRAEASGTSLVPAPVTRAPVPQAPAPSPPADVKPVAEEDVEEQAESVPDEPVQQAVPVSDLTDAPPTNEAEAIAEEVVVEDPPESPEVPVAVDEPADENVEDQSPEVDDAVDEPDDLTLIEGIGPKMSQALIAQGYDTFAKLSAATEEDLRDAIKAEGMRFAPSAESWAEQATYAAKGDWDGLEAFQDTLIAGRYPDED